MGTHSYCESLFWKSAHSDRVLLKWTWNSKIQQADNDDPHKYFYLKLYFSTNAYFYTGDSIFIHSTSDIHSLTLRSIEATPQLAVTMIRTCDPFFSNKRTQ